MPQEDGVSVQQSLVSAALRRLQGEHRIRGNLRRGDHGRRPVPEVALQPLSACFRPLASSVDLRGFALAGMTPGRRVHGRQTAPWRGVGGLALPAPTLIKGHAISLLPQNVFFLYSIRERVGYRFIVPEEDEEDATLL